ncbi:MAG: zinc ribbon domain-containing protein [Pirellulales bacterium]|nr:zinc ribbon domain-containing protein [Pirellulales bacterium]
MHLPSIEVPPMAASPRCQSCGMPLKVDPERGGSEHDGSRSTEYCSYCYQHGKLLQPEMTIDEMRALIIEKLGEKGYPRFIARLFTIGLHRLKRWQTTQR